jgi:hypothetical protein
MITKIINKFWEELTAYFPVTTYWIFGTIQNINYIVPYSLRTITCLLSRCLATAVSSGTAIDREDIQTHSEVIS